MTIEILKPSDYDSIIGELNDWWGGRNMVDMLPRLFFKNFNNTSFIIREKNVVAGFIIGFISQTQKINAYVHFIGVNPVMRNKQIGKKLYTQFFQTVRELGAEKVECVTSVNNETSIKFHQKIGFGIVNADFVNDKGIAYFRNYDGPGEDRVLFQYNLK
ncbi:MAG: family N-acetyltransferase [Fluviicola sp.]|jgi:ribosomal protein S18 acetylase RimI-like enzyme|uniref:GNAT family N-acetyltransferase n=1 Tax=Fluviicola sp. TaxID=1917219 RepID=UPI0026298D0A|nr:GNAT family N-acetyltransferase [Fluviicola sp.]MDF3026023.1 family N-acetyltransferase [Fluviicola sp.]